MRRSLNRLARLALAAVATFGALPASAQQDPFALPAGFRTQAAFSCGNVTVSGSAVVTSAGAGGEGHVVSNGNITLNGSSKIRGNASAGPGKTIKTTGSSQITGTRSYLDAAWACSPIDLAALGQALATTNDNVRIPKTSGGKNPLSGSSPPDLTLSGSETLVLPAGTYYLGKITIGGSSVLSVSGNVRILATGKVSLSGSSKVNDAGSPIAFRLFTSGTTFTLDGSARLKGFVYASGAAAAVKVAGSGVFVGGLYGGQLTLDGSVTLTRDVVYVPPADPLVLAITESGQPLAEGALFARAVTPVVTTTGGVAPVTVSTTLDGAAWTSGTVISANGEHTLAVAVTDSAVPPTQLSETRHFTVDTEGPSLSIVSPPPGAVVSTSPIVVTGTVSGATSLTLLGGQVVLQEGGVFSATVPLVEGTNPLRLVARDAAGNETSRDLPVVLDTLPPVVSLTSPSPGSCLAAGTTLTVAGRYIDAHPRPAGAPEGPAVSLTLTLPSGAATPIPTSVEATGAFTGSLPIPEGTEGSATLLATATDALGNVSRVLSSLRLDSAAPEVSISSDGAPFPGSGTGAAPPPGATPIFVNRALAARALVRDGAAAAPAATLTLDGQAYAEGTPIAAEGNHLLVARVTDCAGHESAAYAFFSVDTTAPALLATVPTENALLKEPVTTFSGTASADVATVTVGGQSVTPTPGADSTTFSLAPYSWREGANSVVVELVDRAGNRASFTRTFQVKTTGPVVEILLGGLPVGTGKTFFAPVTPEIRTNEPLSGSGAATLTTTLDGAPYALGTPIAAAGPHTLTASVVDAAGTPASAEASFTIDTSGGPSVAITSPVDGQTLPGPTVDVSGTVSAAPSAGPAAVRVNGRGAVVSVAGGTWTLAGLPLEPDAPNEIVAVAVDALGRSASAAVQVHVRSDGPKLVLLSPAEGTRTNRRRIDVVGAVVGGASSTADGLVHAGALSATIDATGSFRLLDVPLADGASTLSVTAVDAQGRTGEAHVTVASDTTAPTVSFVVDGQSLEEGAAFAGPMTVTVSVSDEGGSLPAPRILLNGAAIPSAAETTEVPVPEAGGWVLSVVAVDGAGNETRASRSFVVGGGGCELSDVRPSAGSTTTEAKVTIVGRCGAARRVLVRVPQVEGGAPQEYTASVADGTFAAGDVPLPVVGENVLELVCEGASGAPSTVVHRITRLSGDGPVVSISTPAPGAVVTSSSATVSGAVSDATADLWVNGTKVGAAARTGTAFAQPGVALTEGPNVLVARAVDVAGRTAEARVVLQRDSQAPRLTVVWPTAGARFGRRGDAPTVADVTGVVDLGSEPNLASVAVSSPAGSVVATVDPVTGAFRAPGLPLGGASGTVRISVVATDSVGLTTTVPVDVEVDAAGPALRLDAPSDLARLTAASPSSIVVSGEAWASEGATVSVNGISLDPATLAWEPAAADGRRHVVFQCAIAAPTTDGPFGVIVRAEDLQKRSASTRRLLVRDTIAPSVAEVVPASGATGVDANGLVLVLFSEEVSRASLTATNGFVVTREGQPEPIVGTFSVAGSAVAFVPGAALTPGATYRVVLGAGLSDLAGNPLEVPRESSFTVSPTLSGTLPALDTPLPAVVCAAALELKGSAPAGANLRVSVGAVTVNAVADASGRFVLSVPLLANGFHDVSLRIVGRDGSLGPALHGLVRKDCSAPFVERAALDREAGRVDVRFSERMDPATVTLSATAGDGASVVLSLEDEPAVARPGALALDADGRSVRIDLPSDADAWWREKAVRLRVQEPAADENGIPLSAPWVTTFLPGGGAGDLTGGFLSGEVYDDASGRPLDGADVRLYPSAAAIPGAGGAPDPPLESTATDARGRYGFFGDVAAGRYAIHLGKTGYVPALRRLPLAPVTGAVPFDARLTPLAPLAALRLDPAVGGSVEGPSGLLLEVGVPAFVNVPPETLGVRLTPISPQALPELLPLGWSPLAAADVTLEPEGATPVPLSQASAFVSGAVHLTLPLPTSEPPAASLVAVRHDVASGRWLTLGPVDRHAGAGDADVARVALAAPGTVAVVLADAEPAIAPPALSGAEGEPLTASALPSPVPPLTATLTLDPAVVSPTGRATARVVARSADGTTLWPSGLAVQAYLDEKLVLSGGGELYEAPFTADLLLTHHPLSPDEESGATAGTVGALSFAVSPSPKAAEVLLESGWENVRLYPFPESLERGSILGALGGTVTSPDGVELTLQEGALAESVSVEAKLLTDAELAGLPPPAGFDLLAAVRISFSGRTLARAATLSVPLPADAPDDAAGEARLLLAQLVEQPIDARGAFARLTARATRVAGPRALAAPEASGSPLPLEGLLSEGTYLVLRAQAPLGFATGFVRIGSGNGLALSRVTTPTLGTADLSRPGGRYAIPVPAGDNRDVSALHPQLDEAATGRIPSLAPSAVVALDLLVKPVGPHVVRVEPENGLTEQLIGSPLLVHFSEPIDPASVVPGLLTAELLGDDGAATGAFFNGTLTLQPGGATLVFQPTHPLPPGRRIRGRLTSGVRDVGGTPYEGALPYLWSFETSTEVTSGGQIDLSKIRLLLPENGTARIVGTAGAIPTGWSVSASVENVRPSPACPETSTNVDTNGAFSIVAGCASTPVSLSSRVFLRALDSAGNITVLPLGPYVTADGLGFVAQPGEKAVYTTPEGVEVTVPAGAFDEAKVVRVAKKDPATLGVPLPADLELGTFIDIDFEGEAKETLRLRIPVTTTAPVGTLVFAGAPIDLPWGRKLRLLDLARIVDGGGGVKVISNAEADQPNDPPSGSSGLVALSSGTILASQVPRTVIGQALLEFTSRAAAALCYSTGAELTAITGSTVPNEVMSQLGVLWNEMADSMVFVPPPYNWTGHFILPAAAGQAFTVVAKDRATGWVINRHEFGPVSPVPGALVPVQDFPDNDVTAPRLIDASPFGLTRFSAFTADGPEPTCLAIRLELRACATSDGFLRIETDPAYPLPDESRVSLQSLSSPTGGLSPRRVLNGTLGSEPLTVAPQSGEDLLVTVTPGDLNPDGLGVLRFVFDKPLAPVPDPATAIRLVDCGPVPGDCRSAVPFPVELDAPGGVTAQFSEALVRLRGTLPRGHLFRLTLQRDRFRRATSGSDAVYFGPSEFLFATRKPAESPLATSDALALGDTNLARDLVKLGNLLFVATGTGRLLAFDVSTARSGEVAEGAPAPFKLFARMSETFDEIRGLATDGHNRVFLNVRAGNTWGVKIVRLEDVRGAADCPDGNSPSWAQGVPCFSPVEGSVRTAFLAEGAMLGSEYLARVGSLAVGRPVGLELLVKDDATKPADLESFYEENKPPGGLAFEELPRDAQGFVTFGLVLSTVNHHAARSTKTCTGEASDDRYQRVTVDNVTTGQSWSFDVENAWPGTSPPSPGVRIVSGLKARRGDEFRLRVNVGLTGYVPVLGSGVTVVDLNRFYRLPSTGGLDAEGECGRRLGRYEEAGSFGVAPCSSGKTPDLSNTYAIAALGQTGDEAEPRGRDARSTFLVVNHYGGVGAESSTSDLGGLQTVQGVCLTDFDTDPSLPVSLRSVAAAANVRWQDAGLVFAGGRFVGSAPGTKPTERFGDLVFYSLGPEGIVAFDATNRRLGGPVGLYYRKDHWVTRIQADVRGGRLYAGGFHAITNEPFIDVWDLYRVNGGPDEAGQDPRLLLSLKAAWDTNHIAFDEAGTGFLYTWGRSVAGETAHGIVLPIEDPRFVFAGLYRPEVAEPPSDPPTVGPLPTFRPTSAFVPLGVPLRVDPADERDPVKRADDEKVATAAFRIRIALPGDFGETLVAKVQSLRALPAEGLLGVEDVGAYVAPTGGPGWPAREVFVTLRRLGAADASAGDGTYPAEDGRLSTAYNLYESKEVVLLLADPRARTSYILQELEGEVTADEESQCRRCTRPAYLQRLIDDGLLQADEILELLAAGPYLRATLSTERTDPHDTSVVVPADSGATAQARVFFRGNSAGYRAPWGLARATSWADSVPAPIQVSLEEPVLSPAYWDSGERGVGVLLGGGEALFSATDYAKPGRGIDVAMERTYRSGVLGFGPLGSAGWSSPLLQHLRPSPLYGDGKRPSRQGPVSLEELTDIPEMVEYYDGAGHVFRFVSKGKGGCPAWAEEDSLGSYCVPKGLYLRLRKLEGGKRWQLLGRQQSVLLFDEHGRLLEIRDRHREHANDPHVRGNTHQFVYDAFGALTQMEDDYGRVYHFEEFRDPRQDGEQYALLKSFTDFAGRTIGYSWRSEVGTRGDRLLQRVILPSVTSALGAEYSHASPTIAYSYGPHAALDVKTPLHGPFGALRLTGFRLPGSASDAPPRVGFEYEPQSGRVIRVTVPGDPAVAWSLLPPGQPSAAPALAVRVTEPWAHVVDYIFDEGRTKKVVESVPTLRSDAAVQSVEAEPQPATLEHEYTFEAVDGRLLSVKSPGGLTTTLRYVAHADRLRRMNVEELTESGKAQSATGECDGGDPTDSTRTTFLTYGAANVRQTMTDPVGAHVRFPIATTSSEPQSFTVSSQAGPEIDLRSFFDLHARNEKVEGTPGGGDPAFVQTTTFREDARGRSGKGYPESTGWGSGADIYSVVESYDRAGNVDEQASGGVVGKAVHDEWDRPTAVEPGGSDGTYIGTETRLRRGFDAVGHVVLERRAQSPLGEVDTLYTYNDREQLTSISTSRVADLAGGATATATTLFTYDVYGRLWKETSPAGVVTTYGYDAAGRLASTTTGSGVRRVLYDEGGRVAFATDGHEGYWRGRFDSFGELYEERLATGALVRRCFDDGGRPRRERVIDADGEILSDSEKEYTAFGALATVSEVLESGQGGPVKRITKLDYDLLGRLRIVTTGDGGSKVRTDRRLDYDSMGRVVLRTDAVGNRVKTVYDPPSRAYPSRVEHADAGTEVWHKTDLTFDALGNVLFEAGSAGTRVHRSFDETGNLISKRLEGNPPEEYAWDGLGKLLSRRLPAGGETAFGYDLDGRKAFAEVRSPSGVWRTSYSYDLAHSGRLRGVSFPDGSSEAVTAFDPDDVATAWRNRHGQTVTSEVDAANRVVRLGAEGGPPNVATYGLSWKFDGLSRLENAEKLGQPAATVSQTYDLGGRVKATTLGAGASPTFERSFDVWDQPVETTVFSELVGGLGPKYLRQFDDLGRLSRVELRRGEVPLPEETPGAELTWASRANLTALRTLETDGLSQVRGFNSEGRTTSFGVGMDGAWGKTGIEYRPGDGWKLMRVAPKSGVLSRQGWVFLSDSRLRLEEAHSDELEAFRLRYGGGDELLGQTLDKRPAIVSLTPGVLGRPEARNGEPIGYGAAGERTEDERYRYSWSWRGELTAIEVKEQWPPSTLGDEPVVSPWAGHKVSFEYDALGRLVARIHEARLPEPGAARPFISRREYLWDGPTLLSEVEKDAEGAPRWKKILAPGASGLDDAVQMLVEDYGAGSTPSRRLYGFIRDELGTVLGLVDAQGSSTPRGPPVPARYRYTPYGEAHLETGPELVQGRFDSMKTSVGGTTQASPIPEQTVGGAVTFEFTIGLDPVSFAAGVRVETWNGADSEWQAVPVRAFAIAADDSAPYRLSVMPSGCWPKGERYRIRLMEALLDDLARPFRSPDGQPSFDLVLEIPPDGTSHPAYDRKFPYDYDTALSASDSVGGRIPGGMSFLFAGMWCDPVSGLCYARARWYDPRTAHWLSEDPLGAVDSTNLWAYVGWRPHEANDPWGLATDCSRSENPENCRAFQAISARVATERLNGDSVPPVPEPGRDETPGRLGRLWSAWNDLGDRAGRAWRNLWSSNAEPTELQREAGDERFKTGPALGRAVGEIGEPPIRYGTKAAQFVVENKAVTLAVGGVAAAVSTVRRTRSGGLVVLGELDEFGRATGVRARITPDMIGSGTRASSSIRPAGFVGQPGRQHRGHLLGKQLGGVGDDPRNLISMFDSGNTPTMRDFENAVRKAVESGETVDYWAIPVYEGANPLAKGVTLKARGSGGFSLDVSVLNKL